MKKRGGVDIVSKQTPSINRALRNTPRSEGCLADEPFAVTKQGS